ncbi:hypothetical protein KFE25_004589 [Diacronema lutheri]|uniref:Protein kinase domain-containing protein n=1 Tax=Diacronema lutheri TaxID=2081491 RepID=A0A8J5XEU2_DIALT|nr:hypothetical protein KFE25_004589 [Diacronema lutheri]
MVATLRDEWRWLESRLKQLASDDIDAATHAQPLGELSELARETAGFVTEYTSRSRVQRMQYALRDRARMRDLAERLAVLQQRLQLCLQIDATRALRLRERLAEDDVADLEAEAEVAQELVDELHAGASGSRGSATASAGGARVDEQIDAAALDALLDEMVDALRAAKLDETRATAARKQTFELETAWSHVSRAEPLHRAGAAGELYAGTYQGVTRVALKYFYGGSEAAADEVRRELAIQRAVSGPNVLQVFGAMTRDPSRLCLVLELAPDGSLLDAMRARSHDPPPAAELARCARDVVAGVEHLHARQVHHGDLKSANVLRCTGGVWKLCDFGLARARCTTRATRATRSTGGGAAGTLPWMAPELLDRARDRLAMRDKVDCYALGCVFYELLAWRTPWEGKSDAIVFDAVRAGERPRLPVDRRPAAALRPLVGAIAQLWAHEPLDRPPVDLALVARAQCVVEAAEAADAAAAAVVAAGGGVDGCAQDARAQQLAPPPLDAPPPVAQRPPPTAVELNVMSWPQLVAAVRAGAAPVDGAGPGGENWVAAMAERAEEAAAAIRAVSRRALADAASCELAANAGALEAVVAAMRAHAAHSDVQKWACWALRNICTADDAAGISRAQRATEAGALEAVVDAMRAHAAHSRVQVQACWALRNICTTDDAAGISRAQRATEARALEAVVDAMHAHAAHSDLQKQACWALRNICSGTDAAGPARKQRATKAGALEAVVDARRAHAAHSVVQAGVQEQACWALIHVCSGTDAAGPARKQRATKAGALEAVVAAMRAPAAHSGVQKQACWALGNLCVSTDVAGLARARQAVEDGALEAVTAAMRAHAEHSGVQQQACWALANVCAGNDAAGLARARQAAEGALRAVVAAMRAHAEHLGVQEQACTALARVCAGTNVVGLALMRRTAAQEGALEAIAAAMIAFLVQPVVQTQGRLALAALRAE